MTTEEESVTDRLRIDSILPGDQAAAERALSRALVVHQRIAEDMAQLIMQPLTGIQAANQVEHSGHVAGYLPIRLSILADISEAFTDYLASQLCEEPLTGLQYEGVWSMGDVVVVYAFAQLV